MNGWDVFDIVVNALFGVDLLVRFFFTYRDSFGDEVVDLRKCVCRYLRMEFWVSFIACLPEQVLEKRYLLQAVLQPCRLSQLGSQDLAIRAPRPYIRV